MANAVAPVERQFNINDDEIDGIALAARPTSTQAATAARPTAAATPVVHDGVSFDDEDIADSIKPTDLLPVVKIAKGQVARFSFVPGVRLKKASVHYIEGSGSIICNSTKETQAACCTKPDKFPSEKFVGLVFRYTNVDPKTGKFLAGATVPVVEVQAVRLGKANMRAILDSCEDGQSVYDLDIRMKHDDSRAFGYSFSRAASKASWLLAKETSLALAAPFLDGVKLATRLGKKLDALQMNAAFSTGVNTENGSVEKLLGALDSE